MVKIKNYFNPSSIFLESPYNVFLVIFNLKNPPTESHSENGK